MASSCLRGRQRLALTCLSLAGLLCLDTRETLYTPAPLGQLQHAIGTMQKAAALLSDGSARPAEEDVLRAILLAQKQKAELNAETSFFRQLSGHGCTGGKRWRLVYLATKDAVVAARKGVPPPSPWDRGWYVDGFVTAVQRFEDGVRRINQNGVFEFLGLGGFFFGYFARFKWPSPEKRTTMAFQPVTNNLHAFGQDWSWPFQQGFAAGPQGDAQFEQARLQDIGTIFNFLYVDEQVAVAQGASGSMALWGATDPSWDARHLINVKES